MIEALAIDYLKTIPEDVSIDWVCNHSRNSQLALLHGFIDVALTYERDSEALAASEGWSVSAGCVFHDHFCLAGPLSDPAEIGSTTSLEDAFSRLATSKALFHSRADDSATMWKERTLWSRCGLKPWNDSNSAGWYKTSVLSPSEAVICADTAGAYLLTDRSTLLRQTALTTLQNTTVFFEPTAADDILMNSCYALFSPHASERQASFVSQFISYLLSSRGQGVITSFGEKDAGLPSFAPVLDGFARSFLRGGAPRRGRWTNYPELHFDG